MTAFSHNDRLAASGRPLEKEPCGSASDVESEQCCWGYGVASEISKEETYARKTNCDGIKCRVVIEEEGL